MGWWEEAGSKGEKGCGLGKISALGLVVIQLLESLPFRLPHHRKHLHPDPELLNCQLPHSPTDGVYFILWTQEP